MMKHHSAETLAATFILLLCGGGLLYLSHGLGKGIGLMSGLATALGPMGVVLGIGTAIHGRAMPPTHITAMSRLWGTAGSVLAAVDLWYRGYFAHRATSGALRVVIPVVLVLAWWLPAHFYGDAPAKTESGTGSNTNGG